LYSDETVGVAGKVGDIPPMIPIDVKVEYTDGSGGKSYSFKGASHRRFTPLLSTAAVMAAVTGVHDLPEHHTLAYHLEIEFDNGETVKVANTDVDASAAAIFMAIGQPMMAASENPFKEVFVKKVGGIVRITPEARSGEILWVNSPKVKYRPGETLKAYVNYRPFRGEEAILPVEFDLPHDLPDGAYQFSISGWQEFFAEEQMTKPFRFSAENSREMFAVLRDISSVKHDALYMRLMRQPDGVAVGRTAMPSLPSSRREVLMGAGRSNTTPFISSVTKTVAMDLVMEGAEQLELTVEREDRVETAGGKVQKQESPLLPKPEDKPTTPRGPKPEKPDKPAEKPAESPKPGGENRAASG
jgi:hypothetical protein